MTYTCCQECFDVNVTYELILFPKLGCCNTFTNNFRRNSTPSYPFCYKFLFKNDILEAKHKKLQILNTFYSLKANNILTRPITVVLNGIRINHWLFDGCSFPAYQKTPRNFPAEISRFMINGSSSVHEH